MSQKFVLQTEDVSKAEFLLHDDSKWGCQEAHVISNSNIHCEDYFATPSQLFPHFLKHWWNSECMTKKQFAKKLLFPYTAFPLLQMHRPRNYTFLHHDTVTFTQYVSTLLPAWLLTLPPSILLRIARYFLQHIYSVWFSPKVNKYSTCWLYSNSFQEHVQFQRCSLLRKWW